MQAVVLMCANLEVTLRTVHARGVGTIAWHEPRRAQVLRSGPLTDQWAHGETQVLRSNHPHQGRRQARQAGRAEIDHAVCLQFASHKPDLLSSIAILASKVQAEGITA